MNNQPLQEEMASDIAQTFKALADPTRVKILHLLLYRSYSVGEIAEKLEMNQSTISHQLKYLKHLHLVKNKREKTKYIYSIDDRHVMNMLEQTIAHIQHTEGDSK
ncbi:ArsR/SmtB family transcription factor [Virgibacillus xinjiangensis]|uniref:ArsR/SmtB family transcription factor n=1 Tax=Virgibacillus xinjiangensis TaxID=393090 RepID=A0ABV7CQF6_9BACI